jgi:hypothetical protein
MTNKIPLGKVICGGTGYDLPVGDGGPVVEIGVDRGPVIDTSVEIDHDAGTASITTRHALATFAESLPENCKDGDSGWPRIGETRRPQ